MVKVIKRKRTAAVTQWLKKEKLEQKSRYQKIVKEQEDLSPKRDKWIAEFLDRIQNRGFNVHSDMLRKIDAKEIPKKPRRKFKVVF